MNPDDDFNSLVILAKNGDRRATEDLLNLLKPRLEEVAREYADPDSATQSTADLVQEAWLRAWQRLFQFQGGSRSEETRGMLFAWVGQIAHTVGLNAQRDRQAQKRKPAGHAILPIQQVQPGSSSQGVEKSLVAETPTPSAIVHSGERAALVQGALDRIADNKTRLVVRLRVIDGLSLREISRRLDLDYDGVRERYRLGMDQLEQDLAGLA